MSGIFDLFAGTGISSKQQSSLGSLDSSTKLTTTLMTPGKNADFSRNKPKGLSIRSTSELNVPLFNINGRKSPSKSPNKRQYLKPEIGKLSVFPRSLSPCSTDQSSKIQTLKSKQLKASSSKLNSPDNISLIEGIQAEKNLFRKPITPTKMNKKAVEMYPEPDKLENYYDEETYLHSVTNILDEEFVRLMKQAKDSAKSNDDEGFESDPELIPLSTPLGRAIIVNPHKDDEIILEAPALPSLSDDDDDF